MKYVSRYVLLFAGIMAFESFCRVLFLLFNQEGRAMAVHEWLAVFRAALPMDAAVSAFVFTAFLILFGLGMWLPPNPKGRKKLFRLALGIPLMLCSLIAVLDARMFPYWGFRLDRQFMAYLKHPGTALASVSMHDLFAVSLLILLLFTAIWLLIRKPAACFLQHRGRHWLFTLLALPLLFTAGRGGWGPVTMNQSRVYHSDRAFNNMAALNPVWNFVYSFTVNPVGDGRYRYMEDQKVTELLQIPNLAGGHHADIAQTLINTGACKNLVLIVLESFTANAISAISNNPAHCTPHFDTLSASGILFERFYSSGDRSAESLVTLFTGFPAFTRADVLDMPSRLHKLPHLYRAFGEKGYHTLFEYGGDMRFANLKALFVDGRTDLILDQASFDPSLPKSEWGIHDGPVFEDFSRRIHTLPLPFAATVFSLSSHEPFKVPHGQYFKGEHAARYRAMHYTDSCLGKLLHQIRNGPLYDSTLVIITADHGSRQPGNFSVLDAGKFHIPLLIWGGPVIRPAIIRHPAGQTGMAPLLAKCFNLNWPGSPIPCEVFDSTKPVFYAYNDGAGMILAQDRSVFDAAMNSCILGTNGSCDRIRAYLQHQAEKLVQLSAP